MKNGVSQRSFASRRAQLKKRLSDQSLLIAPGVFEMISAKLAEDRKSTRLNSSHRT